MSENLVRKAIERGLPIFGICRGIQEINVALGGSLHPTGMNDVSQIAPKIAKQLRPILYKSVLARYEREAAEAKAE